MVEGGFDLSEMLARARAVQHQMYEVKARLAVTEVVGRSADDSVAIRVTGTGQVVSVEVDPSALVVDDDGRPRLLEGNIMAALTDLVAQQQRLAADQAADFTAEINALAEDM